MFVAAPVTEAGRVIGVVTVAKPLATVQQFVDRAERKILVAGGWLLARPTALLALAAVAGALVWRARRRARSGPPQHPEASARTPTVSGPPRPPRL
jgi:two-component system sensor histidine kinase CreC